MKILHALAWPALVIFGAGASAQPARSAPEPSLTIGYSNVDAALKALRRNPNVTFSKQGDWLIAENSATTDLWSFAPKGHAAYPTAVLRRVVERDGAVQVDMRVLCQATKAACDGVVQDFVALNEQIRNEFR